MKINFPKSEKAEIRLERRRIGKVMREIGVAHADWEEMNKRYQAYTNMLKPTWVVSPDVVANGLVTVLVAFVVIGVETMLDVPTRTKVFSFLPRR